MWLLAGLVAVALSLFYIILNLPVPGIWKFGLAFVEMVIVSQVMIRYFGMSGEMGLILLRSKLGLKAIESVSRNAPFWKFFSDTGVTISYGLMGALLMRGNTSLKSLVAGVILLALITLFVAPSVAPLLSQVLKMGVVEKAQSSTQSFSSFLLPVALGALIVGGLFLLILFSLIFYGVVVLLALLSTLISGTDAIANTAPGGTLLLPGVNLPFVEGVIALIIIMVVHEGAHAILSRIARVPLFSSGIVLFGIIPIGAFVEPDEAKLARTEKVAQTRVLVAGSTANLMTSVFFFALFVGIALSMGALVAMAPFLSGLLFSIYLILGLCFALNFIVGTVNLLPLPFFDGYRILDINIKNKILLKGIMALTVASFLMNFLPWFFVK
jgi:hypothetical protein